jgi:hypothetical protein
MFAAITGDQFLLGWAAFLGIVFLIGLIVAVAEVPEQFNQRRALRIAAREAPRREMEGRKGGGG